MVSGAKHSASYGVSKDGVNGYVQPNHPAHDVPNKMSQVNLTLKTLTTCFMRMMKNNALQRVQTETCKQMQTNESFNFEVYKVQKSSMKCLINSLHLYYNEESAWGKR